ncbi:MAG: Rieske (2Fe-2S) protein, partial [Verrucomicrobiia bacterium]
WLFLERASVLENVGDFISTDLEGEGLIAVRGRDDAIRVFYNVCRHRGTRLCNEAKGNRPRVFTCPYHAWSYGLDGALIAAPRGLRGGGKLETHRAELFRMLPLSHHPSVA